MSSQLPFSTNFYLAFDKQLQERGRNLQQMMEVPPSSRTIYGSEISEKPARPAIARRSEADRFLARGREIHRLLEVPPFMRTAYDPRGCVISSIFDFATSASAERRRGANVLNRTMKNEKRATNEFKEEPKINEGANLLADLAIPPTAQALVELTRTPVDPRSLLTDVMDFNHLMDLNFCESISTTAPAVASIWELPFPGQEDEEQQEGAECDQGPHVHIFVV
ncbi:hypothetical protein BJ165DRAFT_1006807 [Panaeolus papilionaceus]|nr:hypothetical protein BJ165DRAFT_1006807 [Panaeolus papilionaceus]